MLFYKATFYCFLTEEEPENTTAAKNRCQLMSYINNKNDGIRYIRRFNETLRNAAKPWTSSCFIADNEEGASDFTLVFTVEKNEEAFHLIATLKKTLLNPTDEADIQLQEITLQDLIQLLGNSDRNYFSRDFVGPFWEFIRDGYSGFRSTFLLGSNFKELIPEINDYSCKKIQHLSKKYFPDSLFFEEVRRIYSRKNPKKYYGIPVHYDFSFSNSRLGKELIQLLFHALYKNHRLIGQRITFISILLTELDNERNWKALDELCKTAQGTMVVFDFTDREETFKKEKRPLHTAGIISALDNSDTEKLFRIMAKHQRNTQFVFLETPQQDMFHKIQESVDTNLPMIQFTEQVGTRNNALNYLHYLIEESNINSFAPADWQNILTPQDSYTAEDVQFDFNFWYNRALQENVYTAYQGCCKKKSNTNSRIDSYTKLQNMVGLKEIKRVINTILSDFRLRKIRLDAGLKGEHKTLHMLFTGNPGSAKTTCARLLAGILNEHGLLATGEFVECGRSDLVGLYVGWTAKIVKEKFAKARGGILFIDEAYALNSDDHYGPEAINTIVQEMENHRDDVVVIFAGYPEPMEDFLKANEGLRSRIAFHLNFPDYNAEEMTKIFAMMLKEQGYTCNADFLEKAHSVFSEAVKHTEFGNGRFARNLLEQTIMKQSARLIHLNEGADASSRPLHRKDLITLVADDLAVESVTNYRVEKPAIGFR